MGSVFAARGYPPRFLGFFRSYFPELIRVDPSVT